MLHMDLQKDYFLNIFNNLNVDLLKIQAVGSSKLLVNTSNITHLNNTKG
jgi:hypothetical protein